MESFLCISYHENWFLVVFSQKKFQKFQNSSFSSFQSIEPDSRLIEKVEFLGQNSLPLSTLVQFLLDQSKSI